MDANEKIKIIYPKLSYQVTGILFKVHNELGNRYHEKYYQRTIENELKANNIKFKKELSVDLTYNGEKIGKYRLDFLIENKIILEIKAVPRLNVTDFKQVTAYLRSKDIKLGILANFRTEKLTSKRILNSQIKDSH